LRKLNQAIYEERTVFDSQDQFKPKQDFLIQEIPISIAYNGISHVVMMASPGDIEDMAIGFSLTEGIVTSSREIYSIEKSKTQLGIEVNIEISSESFVKLKEVKRNLAGKTGCGICGVESLNYFSSFLNKDYPVRNELTITEKLINKVLTEFKINQVNQIKTGSTHAAAFFDQDAKLEQIREDVGRHNALDKLIGAINLDQNGFVVVSSRASYEMIQKVLVTRIPIIIAMSAPTNLAIELAEKNNLTLIGFATNQRFVVYCGKERLV
jgi:formate dehydrogenase accessory protein FdhD